MKCREAKSDMALQLGHDLPDKSRWEEVRRHVSTCADCRSHYKKLKQTLATLERSQSEATYEVRGSLWPEISTRLDDQQPRHETAKKAWLPIASVMVAALLFVAVLFEPGPDPNAPINHNAGKGVMSLNWSATPDQPEVDDAEAELKKINEQLEKDSR